MRRTLILAFSLGLLNACTPPGSFIPSPAPSPIRADGHGTVEPLGGLTFKPLTAASSRLMGGAGGVPMAASTSPGSMPAPAASAPAPSGAPEPGGPPSGASAGGAESGNLRGAYYGYGGYFGYGGSPTTTPMTLVSQTEAEAPGSKSGLQVILETVVAPVITPWAPDATLVSTQGMVGADGLTVVEEAATTPYYGGPQAGWRLMYVSPSRNEVLTFVVMPTKTTVVRLRWAPLNLASVAIATDSDQAVKKLTAAITDRTFQSEEERTGLDYFMGTSYAEETPGYGIPMPMPRTVTPDWQFRSEVVYAVPPNARWNVSLQQVLGKAVWDLNYYTPYEQPQMGPNGYVDPGYNFNNSARGTVDAVTGTVIRFSRPTKDYYPRQPMPYPDKPPAGGIQPVPAPMPTDSPAPMASAPAP